MIDLIVYSSWFTRIESKVTSLTLSLSFNIDYLNIRIRCIIQGIEFGRIIPIPIIQNKIELIEVYRAMNIIEQQILRTLKELNETV